MPVKPMYRSFLKNNRLLWAFLLVLGLGVGVQAQSLVKHGVSAVDGSAKVGGVQVELIEAVG